MKTPVYINALSFKIKGSLYTIFWFMPLISLNNAHKECFIAPMLCWIDFVLIFLMVSLSRLEEWNKGGA